MLQFKFYGLGCCQTVAGYLWSVNDIENGASLGGAEDFGKGESAYLTKQSSHSKRLIKTHEAQMYYLFYH